MLKISQPKENRERIASGDRLLCLRTPTRASRRRRRASKAVCAATQNPVWRHDRCRQMQQVKDYRNSDGGVVCVIDQCQLSYVEYRGLVVKMHVNGEEARPPLRTFAVRDEGKRQKSKELLQRKGERKKAR